MHSMPVLSHEKHNRRKTQTTLYTIEHNDLRKKHIRLSSGIFAKAGVGRKEPAKHGDPDRKPANEGDDHEKVVASDA